MMRLNRFLASLGLLLILVSLVGCLDDSTRPEREGLIQLGSSSGVLVSEDGASAEIRVRLNIMPRGEVRVGVQSTNTAEGTVEPGILLFNALTYAKERVVTVRGVDDAIVDGNVAFNVVFRVESSEDKRFVVGSQIELVVTNVDNDGGTESKAGLWLSRRSINTTEGGSVETFGVKLEAKPSDSVRVQIFNEDELEGFVQPSVLYFSPETWQTEQTVSITPINDGVADGDTLYSLVLSSNLSKAAEYAALADVVVSVNNVDVPGTKAGFVIQPLNLTTYEGGQGEQFSVALNSKPTGDVSIELLSSDTTEGTVAPALLIFTPDDWSEPQFVTVSPVDDVETDAEVRYTIVLKPAVSSDPAYSGLDPSDVSVSNLDKPTGVAGVNVSPTSGLVTEESGKSASFSVVLTNMPRADVYIQVKSNDPSEGSVSVERLVFSPDTWSVPQTVHVQGTDDALQDGDIPYTISLGPTLSTDPLYDGLPVSTVSLTNKDNESAGGEVNIVVNPLSKLETSEGGLSVKFSTQLVGAPTAEVNIALTVSDPTEGSVYPANLVFSPDNYSYPQLVTVTGLNDSEVDGDQSYQVNFSVTSTDSRYDKFVVQALELTNKDDDASTGQSVKVRIMAANITSGNRQSYDEGHGIRIFQGIKPDVVLIQEFNYFDSTLRDMVTTAFGPEFEYYCGDGQIPNGIISRYPITQSGAWPSNVVNNRDWDWAVVDLPGPKDLLAVSVHLHTDKNAQEMEPLIKKIRTKMEEGSYFLVVGGDFNTNTRSAVTQKMSSLLRTSAPYPKDQMGREGTNKSRTKPYDWVLASPDWEVYEKPVVIGNSTYPSGLVFDSRVYTPLSEVAPVQSNDSGSSNMQHMAVIRDFLYTF